MPVSYGILRKFKVLTHLMTCLAMLLLFPGTKVEESISQLFCELLATLATVSKISGSNGAARLGSRFTKVLRTIRQWPI